MPGVPQRKGCAPGRALPVVSLAALLFFPALLPAQGSLTGPRPSLTIPRVAKPPALEDFLDMEPKGNPASQLARVEGFIQRDPSDGQPASQRTEVYLGYDDSNLYVVFVCFDSEPEKVRARMSRREDVFGDDIVEIMLDTFHDRRRAYVFVVNPLGIQWDALWQEGAGFDSSFDTIWESEGQLTEQGYVAKMAIPFKSLRFPAAPEQTWALILLREIPRHSEQSFWPRVSSRIEGRLNQAATATGLKEISPGRNILLIPFGVFRSFRALDTRDPLRPEFNRERADPDAGLDAKFVFQDSLVLDVAVNPDFAQVESDAPQVTVNQRFEVFFPEKRPFFLENATFFDTPIDLVFTRRIADPQFGVRLTGKLGPYALGAFLIDDESPGELVPDDDPLAGKRALFGIFRLSRDIFKQSTLGVLYTDREFEGSFNRVGGLDGRLKLGQNWTMEFQGLASSTQFLDGTRRAGPAYEFELNYDSRTFFNSFEYSDRAPGFRSLTGFIPRSDIRRVENTTSYRFRPEGKHLIAYGPGVSFERVYDHDGTRLDWTVDADFVWNFTARTNVGFFRANSRERLRPQDFPVLTRNKDFSQHLNGFFFDTSAVAQVTVGGAFGWGTSINFVPPAGAEPELADATAADLRITLRPLSPLRIDHTYILSRFRHRETGESIFTNHILRQKWNWQFNKELSLRVILQYDSTLANPQQTLLRTRKNFNADFLLTYLVNPWTALFIGYNGNLQNIALCNGPGRAAADCPDLPPDQSALIGRRRRFINDAKQFFIKFSYAFRF